MTTEELGDIVKTCDLAAMKRALRAAGFFNCKLDRKLRAANLVDIVRSDYAAETPLYSDGKTKEYAGYIQRGVKNYGEYEFVLVEQLAPLKRGSDLSFTKRILIFARRLEK